MSMAAKLSDVVDEMYGANLQAEGHMDMLPSESVIGSMGSWKHWIVLPPCLPSWSLAWGLPSSCPNTKYCLEIQVTLMEELGAVPPPSHSWMALPCGRYAA